MMKLAGHAMTATLVLLTFTLAADPVPKVAPEPLPPEPKSDPTNVRELYDAYRYYGLPLPPKGSYLVRDVTFNFRNEDGKAAFIPIAEFELVMYSRPIWLPHYSRKIEPIWDEISKCDVPPKLTDGWLNDRGWLFFAAQTHWLGWTDIAQKSFQKGLDDLDELRPKSDVPILDLLREAAWEYQKNLLHWPASDRRNILRSMRNITGPVRTKQNEAHCELQDQLWRTVRVEWHRKGTMDDLFDEFVRERKSWDDIISLGFDAVPAIDRHRNDDRFIRRKFPSGFIKSAYTDNQTVGYLCSNYLWELSGSENRTKSELGWFQRAKRIGDKQWCLDHILTHKEGTNHTFCNDAMLKLLRLKYPEELPGIVNRCAGRDVSTGSSILKAVAVSRLPHALKHEVFRHAEKHPETWHQMDVIGNTFFFDRLEAVKKVRKHLEESLRTKTITHANRVYYDYDPLMLVYEANDSECWNLYCKTLRLFDLYTLTIFTYSGFIDDKDDDKQISNRERYRCMLSLFDDDRKLPDDSSDTPSLYARINGYHVLTLRDLSALRLATELEIDVPHKLDRTPAEWAAIREKVRAAAEKAIAKE